jgi:hypothetical protein
MEKFLKKTHVPSDVPPIRSNRDVCAPSSSSSAPSSNFCNAINVSTKDELATAWALQESRHGLSLTAIQVLNAQKNKPKSATGWTVNKEGQKEYTAFRHGKLVKGGGCDAYKLSLGDRLSESKKNGDTAVRLKPPQNEKRKHATDEGTRANDSFKSQKLNK